LHPAKKKVLYLGKLKTSNREQEQSKDLISGLHIYFQVEKAAPVNALQHTINTLQALVVDITRILLVQPTH
jgi:hypothetical protein